MLIDRREKGMSFDTDEIIRIINESQPESDCLDYKVTPYDKDCDHDLLKDVTALLNSIGGISKNKYIIFGIRDDGTKIGISNQDKWLDDNEFQNKFKNIQPTPLINTGLIEYENKKYGYFCISDQNQKWIYEIKKSVQKKDTIKQVDKNGVYRGQAYWRRGTTNDVMFEEDRKQLNEAVARIKKQDTAIDADSIDNLDCIVNACLIGGWDETRNEDIEFVEDYLKSDYKTITNILKKFLLKNKHFLEYSDHKWTFKDRIDLLQFLEEIIFSDMIKMLYEYAEKLIEESNNYSEHLLNNMMESLSILSNNSNVFSKAGFNQIENSSYCFVKRSIQRVFSEIGFKQIAEMIPIFFGIDRDAFISQIKIEIENNNENLVSLIRLDNNYFNNNLANSLSIIAMGQEHFNESLQLLLSLNRLNELYGNYIGYILMPWYPQTCASKMMRINIIKNSFDLNKDSDWEVLYKLLPRVSTNSMEITVPEYISFTGFRKTPDRNELIEVYQEYVIIACNSINGNLDRIVKLVKIIPHVNSELQNNILNSIKDNLQFLNENDLETVWCTFVDMISRHKKYNESSWALPNETIAALTMYCNTNFPNSAIYYEKRLFKNDQYSLIESSDNRNIQEQQLINRQEEVVGDYYERMGVSGIIELANIVDRKDLVGYAAGGLLNITEVEELIKTYNLECDSRLQCLKGLVRRKDFDSVLSCLANLDDNMKARVLALCVMSKRCLDIIKGFSKEQQRIYWDEVNAFDYDKDIISDINYVILELNRYNHEEKSIFILYDCISNGDVIEDFLIENTLIEYEMKKDGYLSVDTYYIQELITELQKKGNTGNRQIEIELKYLDLLNQYDGYKPAGIKKRMENDPKFIVGVFTVLFSNHTIEDDFCVFEKNREKVFSLLQRVIAEPGKNGLDMDYSYLTSWINQVVKFAKEQNVEKQVKRYIGRVLFNVSSNSDANIIDEKVAALLDEDLDMLQGYKEEASNSEEVHIIGSSGKDYSDLANKYMMEAEKLYENGFANVGRTAQQVASIFWQRAEFEKKHDFNG